MQLTDYLSPYAAIDSRNVLNILADFFGLVVLPSVFFVGIFCDGFAGIFDSRTHTTCGISAASCDVENSNGEDALACQCSTGYKGAITWNGATASGTCVKTQCTDLDPDTLRFVSVTKDRGNEHGSKAIFTCENEFTLVGPRSITCDAPSEDAPWPTPPYCTGRLR